MAALFAVCLGFGIHALQYPWIFDDSFISYRFSANFAAGEGLVYNPGEHVEGFTTFLWVVVLGGLHWLSGIDLPVLGSGLAVLAGVACVVLTYALGRRLLAEPGDSNVLSMWVGVMAAAVTAANASLARYAITGMETAAFGALVSLAILLAIRGAADGTRGRGGWRPTRLELGLGLVLALTAMCRPEGMMYGGIVVVFSAWRLGPWAGLRMGAVFGMVFGAYFGWRYSYFGYPFPNTYYAKSGGSAAHWRLGVGYVEGHLWLHLGILGFIGSAVAIVRRRPWGWLAAAMIGAAAVTSARVGGDISPLYRFLVPVVPIGAVATLFAVRSALLKLQPRVQLIGSVAAVALLCLHLVRAPGYQRFAFIGQAPSPPDDRAKIERNARFSSGYDHIGRWLDAALPADFVIAVNAAGIVPFRTMRPTIDMLGLCDEHIAHVDRVEGPLGHEKHDPAYVLSRRPDLIIPALPMVLETNAPAAHVAERMGRIWMSGMLPGDRAMLELPGFREYRLFVAQIGPAAYTAFFVRADRLADMPGGT